jgi:hypothetical protein
MVTFPGSTTTVDINTDLDDEKRDTGVNFGTSLTTLPDDTRSAYNLGSLCPQGSVPGCNY